MQVGDLATWVGSIGVVGTLAAALYQINTERNLRRAQDERRQAEGISAWVAREESPALTWIAVNNASESPVYEVIASIVAFQGAGAREARGTQMQWRGLLSVVPHGRYFVQVAGGYHGMHFHPAVEVAFTDAAGKHWVRHGNGDLQLTPQSPVDYYELPRPLTWSLPDKTAL